MKSFLTCLLVALTLGLVAKDNEIDLQSTITDVVVADNPWSQPLCARIVHTFLFSLPFGTIFMLNL